MRKLIRSLTFGIAAAIGTVAAAQYAVTISGQVTPCTFSNTSVNIASVQGTLPVFDIDVPLDSNCSYSVTMNMASAQGWFQVGTSCSGIMQYGTASYAINGPADSTAAVVINISCGVIQDLYPLAVSGMVPNCSPSTMVTVESLPGITPYQQVVVPVNSFCQYMALLWFDTGTGGVTARTTCPGGSEVVDTAYFSYPVPDPTANVVINLFCDSVSNPCNAAFNVEQAMASDSMAIPWQITTTNFSSGSASINYQWMLPDGSTSTAAEPGFTFSQPGVYGICLIINTGTCTSTLCDTVVVDSAGYIDGGAANYDCLNIPGGPNLPGTSCVDTLGISGFWNTGCVCVADTNSTSCTAGFWVIQAYTTDSLNPQDTTGIQPIPNEVWVWNLSSGGNGNYQFLWNFGDGTSSTDPYPTHVYDGDGPWVLCLTMTSGNCTDTYCDSVSVDANGILNGMIVDGHSTGVETNSASREGGFTLNVIQEIPTGITETPALTEMNLWPNPVDRELNITYNTTIPGMKPVTVIDPNGRTVISENHNFTTGGNNLHLSTAGLEPGLYMVRIGNDARSTTQRFLKVH